MKGEPGLAAVRWHRSLVFKIAGLMTVSIVAFSFAALHLQSRHQAYLFFREFVDGRLKQTAALEKLIRDDIVDGNAGSMAPRLRDFMDRNPDVAHVCVISLRGVVISSAGDDACPEPPERERLDAYFTPAVGVYRARDPEADIELIEFEVFSDPQRPQYGALRVGFYLLGAVEAEQFRKVINLERLMASDLINRIRIMDFAGIDHVAGEAAGEDTSVRYVIVTDGGFKVLSHPDGDRKFTRLEDPMSLNAERTGPFNPILIQYAELHGEDVMDVSMGFFDGDERLGNIRIGYSLDEQQGRARALRTRMLTVGGVLIGAMLLFSVIMARRTASPVLALSRIALKVGRGDLEVAARYRTGGDEIRMLYNSFNQMIAGLKERDLVKDTFSRYVTKEVAEEILRNPDRIAPGGKTQEVTILFADIRGFTAFAESHEPEAVIARLNEYLSAMVNVIFEYEGTLDKFIGDAIMAVFGAPIPHDDHALRAVRTALDMQARLDELNENWRNRNEAQLRIGIGVNTGEVIVGNIGDIRRMEYTVIGDNVNIASRIEGLTKEFHCPIIISESAYLSVKDRVRVRELGAVPIRGKARTVTVYELLGRASDAD